MQQAEKELFAEALGLFVIERIKGATEPLLKKIAEQDQQLKTISEIVDIKLKEQLKLFVQDMDFRFIQLHKGTQETIAEAIAKLPTPIDGQDGRDGQDAPVVDVDDIVARVAALVPAGKDGAAGQDAEPVILDDVIDALWQHDIVAKVVNLIPVPKNGIDGKDGVGFANAMIDRDGSLSVILTNGSIQKLGPVVGRDGKDGAPGKDGRDGVDGTSGRDGVNFDEIAFQQDADDIRVVNVFMKNAEKTSIGSFRIPGNIHKGPWREGRYLQGDTVSLGGSQFVALRDTETKPETPDNDWQLTVKRGRDGKDGEPGKRGERGLPGKDGKPGRDLTQMGLDGKKW